MTPERRAQLAANLAAIAPPTPGPITRAHGRLAAAHTDTPSIAEVDQAARDLMAVYPRMTYEQAILHAQEGQRLHEWMKSLARVGVVGEAS